MLPLGPSTKNRKFSLNEILRNPNVPSHEYCNYIEFINPENKILFLLANYFYFKHQIKCFLNNIINYWFLNIFWSIGNTL